MGQTSYTLTAEHVLFVRLCSTMLSDAALTYLRSLKPIYRKLAASTCLHHWMTLEAISAVLVDSRCEDYDNEGVYKSRRTLSRSEAFNRSNFST